MPPERRRPEDMSLQDLADLVRSGLTEHFAKECPEGLPALTGELRAEEELLGLKNGSPQMLDPQKDVRNLQIEADRNEYEAGRLEMQARSLRSTAKALRTQADNNQQRLKRQWDKAKKEASDAEA